MGDSMANTTRIVTNSAEDRSYAGHGTTLLVTASQQSLATVSMEPVSRTPLNLVTNDGEGVTDLGQFVSDAVAAYGMLPQREYVGRRPENAYTLSGADVTVMGEYATEGPPVYRA